MTDAQDVESNVEPQQAWTQGIKAHRAGELTVLLQKYTVKRITLVSSETALLSLSSA